jgi:ATP-dependent DNA ligase
VGITYFASERVWLEGIVAKRKDSCYQPGKHGGLWLKYKVNKAKEVVIGGYMPDNPLDALTKAAAPMDDHVERMEQNRRCL